MLTILTQTPLGTLEMQDTSQGCIKWRAVDQTERVWIYFPPLADGTPALWCNYPPQTLLDALGSDWQRTVVQLARLAGMDASL